MADTLWASGKGLKHAHAVRTWLDTHSVCGVYQPSQLGWLPFPFGMEGGRDKPRCKDCLARMTRAHR